MDMLIHDTNLIGRTVQWNGREGVVLAVIPPMADIRDFLGRDIRIDPKEEVIHKPLHARVRSEAARLLVRTPEGQLFAPRRTIIGRKENR